MKEVKITDMRVQPGDSAFLVDDGTTAILYDTGFAFTGYGVAENVKKTLGDRKLDYIFLTHSHYDHALGSVYVLKYWPEAKVVAGEYAAKIFAKPSAKAVMRDLDRKFANKCGITEYEDLIDYLKVDIPVKDGDIIKAGTMTFQAINLPGHTRCSVGYYMPSEKMLLSCETLGVYDGFETVIPSYLIGYNVTLESIEKVHELDVERILIPHFGVLEGEMTQLYLKMSRKNTVQVAEDFMELIKEGKSDDEILEFYKAKYYRDEVRVSYPEDAMKLNTGIMIRLIKKECLGIE